MENTETLNIRISPELKQNLEKQAQEGNQNVSDYVRELLMRRVLRDGIPPDLMEQLKAESRQRGINETVVVRHALRFAFDNLRDGPFHRW